MSAKITKAQIKFIHSLKKYANSLLNFLERYENLYFKKTGKEYECTTDPSIKVYYAEKIQAWRAQDMSGKTKYNHTIDALIFAQMENYSNEEQIEKLNELLRSIACYNSPAYYNSPTRIKTSGNKNKRPTQRRKTPQCAEYEDTDHPQLNATLRYFKEKTGATCNDLKKYGIKAVASPDDSGHFSFAYNTSNATKLKTPDNKKERKYEFTKKEGPYCFGLEQLPEKGRLLFICEGEDDALTMNIHSPDDTGAISFGGTAITKEQREIVEKLKTRFETIYILYDSDTAGIENTRKNAERCKVVPINTETAFKFICEDPQAEPPKDLCDLYIEYRKRTQAKEEKKPKPKPKPLPAFNFSGNTPAAQETAKPEPVNTETTAEIKEAEPFKNTIEQLIKFCEKVKRFNSPSPNTIYNKYEGGHYRLGINQYITEPGGEAFLFIKKMLIINDRNVLTAPAGAGKTTMLIKLCERNERGEIDLLEKTNTEKIVIALPTTAIAEQLYNDFLKAGATDIILACGGKVEREGISEKIVICVFDKAAQYVGKEGAKTFLIIDEYHQTANDYGYRTKAMESTVQMTCEAKKTLLMSATPNLLYCNSNENRTREGEHFLFGFNLIKCTPRITNQIQCKIHKHQATSIDIIAHIIDQPKKGTGLVIIKRDDLKDLEATQKVLKNRGVKSIIIASGSKKYKEQSRHYIKLMQTGEIGSDVEFLLTTTFLEAGINIKTPVDSIHLIDTRNSDRIIQAANRPRLGTDGSNRKIAVFVYVREEQKREEKYKEFRGKSGVEIHKILLLKGKKYSEALNKLGSGLEGARRLRTDTDENTTRTAKDYDPELTAIGGKVYTGSTAGVTYEMYKIETSYTTENPEQLKKQIESTDPRFKVEIQTIKIQKKTDTARAIKEEKAIETAKIKDSLEALAKLICGDSSQQITLECLALLTKSRKIKDFLKTHFNISRPQTDEEKQILSEHKDNNKIAFQYPERKINNFLNQVISITESRSKEQSEEKNGAFQSVGEIAKMVITMAVKEESINEWNRRRVTTERGKESPSEWSAKDQVEQRKWEGIKKKVQRLIRNIRGGRRKNYFTIEDITKITNRGANEGLKKAGINITVSIPKTKAMKIIQTHFKIIQAKGKKKGKKYYYFLTGNTDQ